MTVIDKLRTPIATLIVLCAALLSQMPHAADVFRILVAGEGFWAVAHGYAYAIALELAVLLFVVQRRNAESYIFAVVSVLVNLSYYALHGTNLFSIAALPAWLVSIALPAAIARYSHLLVESPAPSTDAAKTPTEATATQTAVSDTTIAPPRPATPPSVATSEATEPNKLTPTQRRAHIAEQELFDAAQVVAQFGVSMRTAQADIAQVRGMTTQRNGKAVHA